MSNSARCLIVLFLMVVFFPTWRHARSEESTADESPVLVADRAAPETIRETTEHILADPKFAVHRSPWEWLADKLRGWRKPRMPFGGWLGNLVWFLFMIWAVLTLLAILGHWAWSAYVFLRSRSGSDGRVSSAHTHFKRVKPLSYEQWLVEIRRLADAQDFRGAVCAVMAALLRKLNDLEVLHVHPAKTNGDYVHEYAADRGGRDLFRTLTLDFDRLVYGSATCEQTAFLNINLIHERIVNDVRQESQN